MSSGGKFKSKTLEYVCLGCDKNLVDTERILARLKSKGWKPVPEGKGGEVLLINTCGFITPAKQESIEQILQAVLRKKRGEVKKIVVVGCLVELAQKELAQEIPEVDLWVKFSERELIPQKIHELFPDKTFSPELLSQEISTKIFPRFITTPDHISYLKISEGCDRACRFCVIPKIRGRFRSEPKENLIAEAKFLESSGVKELNLVAQDLCDYGKDLGLSLLDLIEDLLKETKIPWLRLFYLNPEGIRPELLELMASEERICKYLDLPFQHISDRILQAMGRKIRERELRGLIERIKNLIPEVSLRGTALVGFPSESDDDFARLKDFVEETEFDWLGVFAFSAEPEALASGFTEQIPESVARLRKEELENLWQELAERKIRTKIGKALKVLVDSKSDLGFNFQGRTQAQAYGLDGIIQLKGRFKPGHFYTVEILDSLGLDLIGKKFKEVLKR